MIGSPTQPAPPTVTPMQELLKWSQSIPEWQRDALRRLCQHDSLSENDMAELTSLCWQHHQPKAQNPVAGGLKMPAPLGATHIRAGGTGVSVAIKNVKDVAHVNALADAQTLKFRETGLNVVFGGNGSGKSGYARVLKKACRARAASGAILPNVYAPNPKVSATAVIDYVAAGKSISSKWTDGTQSDEALSAVSVFDSACAVAHVEKSNDVAYTPEALDLLGRLADTCREVKRRLLQKQQAKEAEKSPVLLAPKCQSESQVGKALASLTASSTIVQFEKLSTLNDAEKARLETLRRDLSSDPRKQAEQHRLGALKDWSECTL